MQLNIFFFCCCCCFFAASPTCHSHSLEARSSWTSPCGRWWGGRRGEWRAILEAIGN